MFLNSKSSFKLVSFSQIPLPCYLHPYKKHPKLRKILRHFLFPPINFLPISAEVSFLCYNHHCISLSLPVQWDLPDSCGLSSLRPQHASQCLTCIRCKKIFLRWIIKLKGKKLSPPWSVIRAPFCMELTWERDCYTDGTHINWIDREGHPEIRSQRHLNLTYLRKVGVVLNKLRRLGLEHIAF